MHALPATIRRWRYVGLLSARRHIDPSVESRRGLGGDLRFADGDGVTIDTGEGGPVPISLPASFGTRTGFRTPPERLGKMFIALYMKDVAA